MKPRKLLGGSASVCLLVVAVLLATAPAVLADVVSVDLGLTAPQDPMNVLELSLTVSAQTLFMTRNDSDSSTATGNILADLGVEFDPATHEVSSVDELKFTGGTIYFTDVSFLLGFGFFGNVSASETDVSGTLDTPDPPSTVTGGTFNPSEHLLLLNNGQFYAEGTDTIGGLFDPNPLTIDYSEEPVEAATDNDPSGSLAVSLAVVDRNIEIATYDVTLGLPVGFDEAVYDNSDVVMNVGGVGTLEATGQFTREISYFGYGAVTPEISTGLEEAAVGATSFVRGPADTELEWTLSSDRVDGAAEVVDDFTDPIDAGNLHQFQVNSAAVAVTSERIDVRDFAGVQVSVDVRAWQTSLGFEGEDDIDLSVLASYDGLNFDEEIFWLEVEGERYGGNGSLEAAGIVGDQDGPFVTFGSPLGLIPDGVQSLRVVVAMDNDSLTEHFFWDNVLVTGIPVAEMSTLTWDGLGDGSWDSTTQWTGGEVGQTPSSTTHVVVPTNTVTVDAGGAAYTLLIDRGGKVVVDPGQTLAAGTSLQISTGELDLQGTLDVWSAQAAVGTLTIGPSGSLNTGGDFTMEQTEYACELDGAGAGLIAAAGDVELNVASVLSVRANSPLDTYGDLTRTIITAAGPGGVIGTFAVVPEVGDFSLPPNDQGRYGTYLGSGVWFGNDRTGEGVTYVENGGVVTAVRIAVFQALEGDSDGDRDVDFTDFNSLANNYTGTLTPGTGDKDWSQGDFDLDQDVDFTDFNSLANNYTGTDNWYAKKGATDGRAIDGDAPGAAPELIVDLVDGSVVMTGGPAALNGYSVTSASGSLLPDDFPMPLPLEFYMSNSPDEITAGVLGMQVVLDGSLQMPWGIDAGGPKGEPDLVFSYGTSAGTFQGNVVYVVPEPSIPAVLLTLAPALGLFHILRRKRK